MDIKYKRGAGIVDGFYKKGTIRDDDIKGAKHQASEQPHHYNFSLKFL